jgi:hypothetical protein
MTLHPTHQSRRHAYLEALEFDQRVVLGDPP